MDQYVRSPAGIVAHLHLSNMPVPSPLFSKVSSSTRRLLSSPPPQELPRWRSPSPMAASMIPPPIIHSMHLSPPPAALARSMFVEPASPVGNRQAELEADIQFLLDAQAGGLVKGLEGALQDDQISTGSTTPTAQSVRSASARRRTRPTRAIPGLKSARKGIYNAMLALSSLKDEELADIHEEVKETDRKLSQVTEWETRRDGLHQAAKGVHADEDAVRAQRLRQEADVLQGEINSVELQLADLKARHRKLLKQAAAVENSVQARLSSYTSSLRLLEEDVQKFLSLHSDESHARSMFHDGRKSMSQLPPKRRTLEMAKGLWNEDRQSTMERQASIQHEKGALDEGAAIWKNVVAQVTDFERRLRAEVSGLSSPSIALNDPPAKQQPAALMESMTAVMQTLESNLELARDRNWNLLIAAIGAELDALRQGRQMLEEVSQTSMAPAKDMASDASSNHSTPPSPGEEIHGLDKSFRSTQRRVSNGGDSDPDPELMFSKHDINSD